MCDIMYMKKKASWASRLVIGFNFKTRKKKSGYSLASFIDIRLPFQLLIYSYSEKAIFSYCSIAVDMRLSFKERFSFWCVSVDAINRHFAFVGYCTIELIQHQSEILLTLSCL